MPSITLVHTADLHSRLTSQAAQRLGRLREQNAAPLFDSGDAVGALNITVRRSEPILELMNRAGYQAMAIGNREYFFRKRGMIHKTRAAEFAVLAANIKPLRGGMGHIQPHTTVVAPNGERLGLFGLTPTMIAAGSWTERLSDMRFILWQQAAKQAVADLYRKADWLVALSHLGREQDRKLIEMFPQIDVVLGGHSHPQTTQVSQIAGTVTSYPRPYGKEAALIEVHRRQGIVTYEASVVELR